MTDLYGNTAEFTYHNSQIGGRWVVSEIDFNSGDIVLEYDYNNSGFLETVERNEEVKSTYSYDVDTFYNAATLTWHERMRTGHDANDTLLLSVDYQSGDGTVVNQFANILYGRKNGLGQIKSMIYPDQQNPGWFDVLTAGRLTRVKYGQSVQHYTSYVGGNPGPLEDSYASNPGISATQMRRAQPPVTIDETGYQITNTYDSAGNLIGKTYPDSSYEKWIYNSIGQATYYRDRAGFVTVTEYNNAFQPVRVIRGMTDPSGTGSPTATSEAVQDIFGYYGTSHANEGQLAWSATTAYSGGSFSAPSTDLRTDYTYNANQRLIKIQTPTPHRGSISLPGGFAARPQVEFGWTGGLKTSETNQLGHTTYFSYDELGRLVETLYSDSTKAQVYYDDVNRKVYRRDRTGRVSLSVYGPSGRLSMQYAAYGTDADLSDGTVSQINALADSQYTSYGYGVGDSQPVLINRGGAVTTIALDYRGRPVEQHQHVRSDDFTLTTLTNYVGNQRFYTTNKVGSHEVRTYYGYSADRQTVRTIQTRKPGVTFGNNAAILSATRQTGADPDYIINDAVRDIRGQIVQLVDPLGIESLTTYDALGRSLIQARSKGSLELVSESVYDHLGNVIETTSEIGLVTEMEYDPAGNLKVRTVAPGTSDELEWSYCYDLDGHLLTETAPGSAVTTHVRETCCSLTEGIKNALGHGTIVNKDSTGRTVHTATVKDFDEHTNLLNPLDGKTLSEQTTRYGVDGRVQYQTHWKVPLGAINRNDPPIAGLNSVPVGDGLTTQYVYFRGITNEQEVEYSRTINLLGGDTEDVSIDAALAKLYSSIASGGVNWEFGDSSCGSATVVIAPDEKTMQVSISDAAGRTVMQATMTGPTATTPNQLVNWSCTRYDDIDTATNAIHTLKTSQIDPDGKVVASFADGLGRTIAVVDQLGKKSTSQFDSGGNLLKSINALSKETIYTYDGLGRQLTVKDPLNNTQTTVYDPDTGQVTQRKDAKNVSTYFAYDGMGRNTTTTDRLGKVTTRTYDSAGRLGTIVDAQSKTTTYGYDLLGQRTSVTLPDTSSKTFEFDAAGRVTKVTLESGITQKTIYEFSGVVDKIEYRDDSNTLTGTDDFTYNALLQRTAATSRYGVVNGWTYDDLGRTLTESTTYSGKTYTVGYGYDSRGRLEEITYPSGRKAEYTFDERSAIDLIKWDSAQIENRGYDDTGRLTSVDRPGVDETRGYDDAGRLTSIGNTNVGTATYTYDANHNKLSESWSGAMAAWSFTTENGGTYTSGYDAEDRFRNFIQSGQSKSLYLDRSDIGNITNYQMNSNNSYRTYNNVHALTNVGGTGQTFDDDGNLTASYHGHTLGWDETGMLKQVVVPSSPSAGFEGTNEYGYDATQRRIFKKITRSSTIAEHVVSIYAGPNLIAEYDAGANAGSPSQEYVYAQEIDSLVLLVRSGGSQKLTITRNQQWSVTALCDLSAGTVLERYTYDAFGKRTILAADGSTVRSTSSYNMPFGYTSRQHDPETGLMYFRARYYDPSTGEFLSQDPLEYVDGMSQYRGYFVGVGIDPFGLDFIAISDRLIQTDPIEIDILGRKFVIIARTIFFHYSVEFWTCPCGIHDGRPKQGVLISRDSALATNCTPTETTELVADLRWQAMASVARFPAINVPVMISSIHYPGDLPNNTRLVPLFVGDFNSVNDKWQDVLTQARTYEWAEQRGAEFANWTRSLYNPFQTNSNTFAKQVVTGAGLPWINMPGSHPQTHRVPSQNWYPFVTFTGAVPTPR